MINWILLAFAGFVILLGFYYALRGIFQRSQTQGGYNVGRQEARLARRHDLLRGIVAVLLGAVLLLSTVVWGGFAAQERAIDSTITPATATPAATNTPIATAAPTLTNNGTATVAAPPPPPTPAGTTQEAMTPAATNSPIPPTETPAATATTEPLTAVVNSGVGVWLRAVPGVDGEQLEWVLDGTELLLLDEVVVTEDFTWQYVQTPSGNIGWVAAAFIQIIE